MARSITATPGVEGWEPTALPRPARAASGNAGHNAEAAAQRLSNTGALHLDPPGSVRRGWGRSPWQAAPSSPRPTHFPPRPRRAQLARPQRPGHRPASQPRSRPHQLPADPEPALSPYTLLSPAAVAGHRSYRPRHTPHLPPRPSARLLTDSVWDPHREWHGAHLTPRANQMAPKAGCSPLLTNPRSSPPK